MATAPPPGPAIQKRHFGGTPIDGPPQKNRFRVLGAVAPERTPLAIEPSAKKFDPPFADCLTSKTAGGSDVGVSNPRIEWVVAAGVPARLLGQRLGRGGDWLLAGTAQRVDGGRPLRTC